MKIARRFTRPGGDVFASVSWSTRASRIANLDGSTVFEMKDAQVPSHWSQLATDIMVSKYFRKAGVPQVDEAGKPLRDENGNPILGPERSAKQVIHRLAGCWRHWGQTHGYFDSEEDAQAFYDELCYMMLMQMAAPNSPQWFNTGLHWAYGISSPAQGHWIADPKTGETRRAADAYTHPQPHACFIQAVADDLVNEGGIMDLWTREARLFKYGSGTGTNFSTLRGADEQLSGGGKSSGLMSFLRIGDRAAGAIKSGGTTRRAAKMVCLDLDHPDIEEFVNWKVREELKVAALVEGMKHFDPQQKEQAQRLGLVLDYDFNGEAYQTVSGQNSNNSVRISNAFFKALAEDGTWNLYRRTDGQVHKTLRAQDLWDQIAYAAWRCADPGVQYDTTINQWHTCPESGRINASNPCSEYMFLDDTACNLASFNLLKFYDAASRTFDVQAFEHATHLWTIVLEISVLMASFPSREIARKSFEFRTLGLGYANLGALLMQAGIPYDSDQARALCGAITAILTGRSYATSAQLAAELGPFAGFAKNRDAMMRVIRNHRRAAYGVSRDPRQASASDLGDYEGLDIRPVPIDASLLRNGSREQGGVVNAGDLLAHARKAWDDALELGTRYGYRNAQVSVIAPTGTIGLLMDCDTTGVEPDFALVKFKKLAGGGYFKIANQSLKPALESLGYTADQVSDILHYVMGRLHLNVSMPDGEGQVHDARQTFADFLRSRGMDDDTLRKITEMLPTVFELNQAFTPWTLGSQAIDTLGLTAQAREPGFNVLRALGLTRKQVAALNMLICGTQTVEGAPHLREEHLPVFDCANTCGPMGKRFIEPAGHIRMMAAAQPFISGAISKTINLPNNATIEDIQDAYRLSWELGLKANALYRDGCKLSQPLNAKTDADDVEDDDQEGIEAAKQEVAGDVASAAKVIERVTAGNGSTDQPAVAERIIERIIERPLRRRLPDTRRSITHKFNVAGHEGYLTVGLYDDGAPGELFISMAKEGSTIGGVMDSLGTAISVALQYGVPVESLVNKFTHQRFEPAGMTHNPDIPFAKSLVDYIFRWMGMEFVPGYRAANAPRRSSNRTDEAAHRTAARDRASEIVSHARASSNGQGSDGSSHVDAAQFKRNLGHGEEADDASPMGRASQGSPARRPRAAVAESSDAVMLQMTQMQADAPACDVCGTITVRSGTCYKCINCGNSMGCS